MRRLGGTYRWLLIALVSLVLPASASAATIPFLPTGSMSTPRYGLFAASLPGGRVLVGGGYNGSSNVKSAEIYDPVSGTFSSTVDMGVARYSAAAAPLPDGRVLVAGGDGATAETFNPATYTFSPVGSMSTIRQDAAAAPLPDGRVLVAGGYNGATTVDSAEIFDPKTNTFSSAGIGHMFTPRLGSAAGLLGDGRVLIAGGYNGIGDDQSSETFDPKTNTFTREANMPQTRSDFAGASLPDGRVAVFAGQNPGGDLNTALTFDPATNVFSSAGLGTMATGRKVLAAAPITTTGQVLVVGGYYNGDPVARAELFGASAAFTAKVKGKKLVVTVASPGTVSVAGATAGASAAKKSKSQLKPSSRAGGPGLIRLKLKLRKPAARKLARKGKLKLRAAISFSPDAGFPRTETQKLKLKHH